HCRVWSDAGYANAAWCGGIGVLMMHAGRSVAFLVAATGIWLAGVGLASADPGSSPPTPATPGRSSPASPPGSPAAPSLARPPPTGPASDPPSGLTATFNGFCGPDFGWDVTNHSAVTHTVHIEVNFTQVGAAVTVAPGATARVPLSDNTEAGSEVQLLDETGAVIDSFFPGTAVCTAVDNISATIRANTSYTVGPFRIIAPMPPSPEHGVVAAMQVSSDVF